MSLFYCAIANEKFQSLLFRNVADGHLFFSEQGVGVHALKSTGILFVAVTELQASRQQCVQFITDVSFFYKS
ncbi:unnamed protein product [Dicrocoelium dendriticum]|nr:unnamed protein product [Dicrocoelium dendriticum]